MMQTVRDWKVLHDFAERIERGVPNAAGRFWLAYAALGVLLLWLFME